MNARESVTLGERVTIPPYTDDWMRGDRTGVVTAVHPPQAYFLPVWVTVCLDKSGRRRRFIAADCGQVGS